MKRERLRCTGGRLVRVNHRGRGILLGLEFLIAADIIYTVAVELTFETVVVPAIVVLIRAFLSCTLEVDLTERWPWQERKQRGRVCVLPPPDFTPGVSWPAGNFGTSFRRAPLPPSGPGASLCMESPHAPGRN